MRRLLVTGAAGFIGTNFVHFWAEHHPSDVVIGLDALTYAGNLSNLEPLANHERFTFIKGDIRDGDAILGRDEREIGRARLLDAARDPSGVETPRVGDAHRRIPTFDSPVVSGSRRTMLASCTA